MSFLNTIQNISLTREQKTYITRDAYINRHAYTDMGFGGCAYCGPIRNFFVRVGRIELPSHPWQGRVLPLNHTRI